MGPPERDEELIRRFLLGDADAFERLVERHRQRVFNLCLRILGDREDAADAAQETFLSVLTKLRQFRGDAAFTTWMHRVTVNACHDLSRKRRREPLLRLASDQDLPEAELAPPVPDHAEEMAGTLDAVAALKEVPEEFRVALVLADLHDLAYDQIAKVLDIPIGTVKSRVHRGRVALARAMGSSIRELEAPFRASEEQP